MELVSLHGKDVTKINLDELAELRPQPSSLTRPPMAFPSSSRLRPRGNFEC